MADPKASTSLDSGIEQLLGVPDSHIVSWKKLKELMRLVVKALPIGAVEQTPQGRVVRGGGGAGAAGTHAWQPSLGPDAESIYIYPGTIDGIVPTIDAEPMDSTPRPPLTVDPVELARVYLEIDLTPLVENKGSDDFPFWVIVGCVVNMVQIISSTTDPVGTDATVSRTTGEEEDGTYYRHICSYQAGALTAIERTPMDTMMCDDGAGNGLLKFMRGPNP